MICERGGCPGCGSNHPHPGYAFLMLAVFLALFVVARYFGFAGR